MKIIKKIGASINFVSCSISAVSFVLLVVMMMLVVINVLDRFLFSDQILGQIELCSMIMCIMTCCALGYAQTKKKHVHVTMFIAKLPQKPRFFCFGLTSLLSTVGAGALGYAMVQQAGFVYKSGSYSDILKIPYFPFYYLSAFGIFILTLVMLYDSLIAFAAIFNRDLADEIQAHWS